MKKYKKFISALFAMAIILCSLCSCTQNTSATHTTTANNSDNLYTEPDDNIITGGTQYPDFTTTTTEPEEQPPFLTNPFNGNIDYEDKLIERSFQASVSGTYRFDFELTTNANARFKFTIKDQTKLIIKEEYDINTFNGVTVDLEENKIYQIFIEQQNGFSEFIMHIGVPNPIQTIDKSIIKGSLNYTDKLDCYSYTAPEDGMYRFDFVPSDYTVQYYMKIEESTKLLIKEEYFQGPDGITAKLDKGKTYFLYIKQRENFADYELNIGVPNGKATITGNKISGNINFTGQQDVYEICVSKTGKYTFSFDFSDANTSLKFKILSSKNENIFEADRIHHKENEDIILNGGEKYIVYVEQKNGMCKYDINFKEALQ
jgi:hypothetical protein